MNMLLTTLNNSLPLFLTLGLVVLLRKKGVFQESLSNALSPLIFKLVLPVFAFNIIYNLKFGLDDWPVLLFIFVANLSLLFLIVLLNKVTKFEKPLLGTLLLLSLAYSVGPVAYPFVQLNFEQEVFSKVVSIDVVLFVSIMVFGPLVASLFDDSKKTDFKNILRSVVSDPVLVAVFLGGVLNYLKIDLPVSLEKSAEFLGGSFVFLVTVFVGLSLKLPDTKRLSLLIGATASRLVVSLVLSFVVVKLFAPAREMALAIPLTLFMSFSSFPLVYTDKHKLDSQLVAQASIFSRLVVFILYPILITILKVIV